MSDKIKLSTMRQEDFSEPVPGSITVKCSSCGSDCWLSPATKQALAGKDFDAECNRCHPPLSVLMEEEVEIPSLGQEKEVENYTKGGKL